MGPVDRVTARLVASDVPLRKAALLAEARRIAAEEAPLAGPGVADAAVDSLLGLGPLEVLLADPAVTDILVNGPDEVWVERAGTLEKSAVTMPDAAAIVAAVERVIAPLGLRLDHASPAVDARLPDGSRLHAVIPPASIDGPVVAIRRFTPVVPHLDALVACRGVRLDGAALLREAVTSRANILVSGGTGSGKTTLLNILSGEIPAGERVVTIEDSAELRLSGHVVRLEARPPNAEGAGEITLQTLVRQALRMRPDRIVVGEVRGPEALDLIQAMSTGHAGSMGTVHANGPDEALWRLETLAASGSRRVPEEAVRRQLRSAVDLVVHMDRVDGVRRVARVAQVEGDRLEAVYQC
ncbi:MAG: CpaF family protein [Actinobacteria bacterium]|nr:CpaF family protein [Actinomycetota bacterium]MBU1493749.1 CpaF family protein [Actinomycetota bacterium]MBU1865712.1 CpaF family protein [Actinomycetota bacterium]